MKQSSQTIVKNVVIAVMLSVAALATVAVTQTSSPTIEASTSQAHNG